MSAVIELAMPRHPQPRGDLARRLDLTDVALAVAKGQRVELEPVGPRDRRGGVRVEATTEKDDGARHGFRMRPAPADTARGSYTGAAWGTLRRIGADRQEHDGE
jgi:hypothetical protein